MSVSTDSMNDKPIPKSGLLDIAAYVPGKSKTGTGVKVHKLSSNETPLGPSPMAKAAFEKAGSNLELYPDPASNDLRNSIAKTHGLNPENIVCGNGSDDLLALLANSYLGAGDEAIYSEHGFLLYPILTRAAGATPIVAEEVEQTSSADNILKKISVRTKMVFLANPNNPTGTYLPISEVRRLQQSLPKNVLLVLDAAYAEYVRRNDYESGIELVSNFKNVVMTRTFSKIHGLAALRLGWCYAPAHIVDVINRIRGPFNVNKAAQQAGIAAMDDHAHIERSIAHNDQWLTWLSENMKTLGLTVTPSVGNFILVDFGTNDAAKADSWLSRRGYITRAVTEYGFPNALRISIGTQEANQGLIAELKKFLEDTNE